MKKTVTNSGIHNGVVVYLYDGHKVLETRNGSNQVVQQFVHGTQYVDEVVMTRVKDKGDLYVHQGERSERPRVAIGKASWKRASDPRARPERASRTRASVGANWNVLATTDPAGRTAERWVYRPYGEFVIHQASGFGDRDGDGDVDATDKGSVGTTCTGTVSGSCRVLDLDFDGDYDAGDATKFDSLPQGLRRSPGRTHSALNQPFAHQGLLFEPETQLTLDRADVLNSSLRRVLQPSPAEPTDPDPRFERYIPLAWDPPTLSRGEDLCRIEFVCWPVVLNPQYHHCEWQIVESSPSFLMGACSGTMKMFPMNASPCGNIFCSGPEWDPNLFRSQGFYVVRSMLRERGKCHCLYKRCHDYPWTQPYAFFPTGTFSNSNTNADCLRRRCGLPEPFGPMTGYGTYPGWNHRTGCPSCADWGGGNCFGDPVGGGGGSGKGALLPSESATNSFPGAW